MREKCVDADHYHTNCSDEVDDFEVGMKLAPDKEGTVITVQCMDVHVWDPFLIYPTVTIHVLDRRTGKYIQAGSKFNEHVSDVIHECTLVKPMSTEPVSYDGSKKIQWNQSFYLPVSFQEISMIKKYVIIFVEIKGIKNGCSEKESMVAWGFMNWVQERLPTGNNYLMTYEVLLYEAQKLSLFQRLQAKSRCIDLVHDQCKVFTQYLCQRRTFYPSILHVAIEEGSEETATATLSKVAISRTTESMDDIPSDDKGEFENKQDFNLLSRKRIDPCLFPDVPAVTLEVGEGGEIILRFNNIGDKIAVTSHYSKQVYSIKIHRSHNGFFVCSTLAAHHGRVYDLQWSKCDEFIVTTSVDYSLKVWETNGLKLLHELKREILLDGPLTCALFETFDQKAFAYFPRIFTGSDDGYVRLWDFSCDNRPYSYVLSHRAHKYQHGPISAMVLDQRFGRLYVGDKVGCIAIWGSTQTKENDAFLSYTLLRCLDKFSDFKGKIITHLHVYYKQQRGELLISASPGATIRSFNLISQELEMLPSNMTISAKNQEAVEFSTEKFKSTYSPDGKFLMIGTGKDLKCWDILACQQQKFSNIELNDISSYDWCNSAHIIAVADRALGIVVLFQPKLDIYF
jgi:hypothetical protein